MSAAEPRRRRGRPSRAAQVALGLLGVAVVATLVVGAREPAYFKRWLTVLVVGPRDPPLWFYRPQERIEGREAGRLPRTTPAEAGIDPVALERAAAYAGARNTHALLVARHGHVVFERYWSGTDYDTLESAHSFGKTLAALAVGAAVGERRIRSIEQPAADFLPEWRNDARREITLRDLLQMSSGLEEAEPSLAPWSPAMRQYLGTDLIAEYLKPKLAHRAGVDWTHQNVDAEILAIIVERATGQRYAEWVAQKIWKPIGAGDAWLFLDHPGGMAHAECCIVARQGDWLRLGELLGDDGVFDGTRVLPVGWVGAMRLPARGNPNYGFQLWLGRPYVPTRPYSPTRLAAANRASEPYAADDVFFLDGEGKYRLWVVPSLGLVILRTGRDPASSADWDDARIPNLVIRGVSQRRPAPPPGARPDLSTLVPGH